MKKVIPSFLHFRPVDKNAVRVAFFRGVHWYPTLPKHVGSVFSCPPTRRTGTLTGQHPDVAGMRRGYLTALYHHHINHKGKEIWLMRCDCGTYCFRHIDGWARRVGVFDQCLSCNTRNALTHTGKSRATHDARYSKWVDRMAESGFTKAQCDFIKEHNLPTEDLEWLKGALKEIKTLSVKGGVL